MKKLLLLGVPLLLVGALMGNKGVEANFADNDDGIKLPIDHVVNPKPWERDPIEFERPFPDFGKIDLELPLDVQDPSLQKNYANEQDIQNQKSNFGSTIGKGVDIADSSPFAFKNNGKNIDTDYIFKTSFLNDLYEYGNYGWIRRSDFDSKCSSNAQSLSTKVGTGVTVSTGVKASYACITAEVSTEVGFNIEFSNSMSESSLVYDYNWIRETYSFKLPTFEQHENLYKKYLTDSFKTDLADAARSKQQWKYEELFQKYGSHIVMGASYGGASTVFGSIISNQITTGVETEETIETEVAAGFEANGYGLTASVGVGTSFSQALEVSSEFCRETFSGSFFGGNAVPGARSLDGILQNARAWTPSVDSNPILVKYNNIVPVWKLLTGSLNTYENVESFEEAFEIYCEERESYYLEKARAVKFNSNLTDKYDVTHVGEENKITGYWEWFNNKYTRFSNTVSLYSESFYDLQTLEAYGFKEIQIVLNFTARATSGDTKVRAKMEVGGQNFGYDYYYSLKQNEVVNITYETYTTSLYNFVNVNSNISVTFETNAGGFNATKTVYLSHIYYEIKYVKPGSDDALGTANNPYKITSVEEFNNIRNDMDGHYKLMKNLDFGNAIIQPIPGTFNGSLNGNNRFLTNFRLEKTTNFTGSWYQYGLFESLGVCSRIYNLEIKNASVLIETPSNKNPIVYAGFLCGIANGGLIENVTFNNTVAKLTSKYGLIGTAVGYTKGTIRNCNFNGVKVYGRDVVGGITGTADSGAYIYQCNIKKGSTNSEIELNAHDNSTGSYVAGGICGYSYSSEIKTCNVENTNFRLTGDSINYPAMGIIAGHLFNGKILGYSFSGISKSISGSNTDNNHKKYYFAYGDGVCGKVEGSIAKITK